MATLIFGSIGVVFSAITAVIVLCCLARAALEYFIEAKDLYWLIVEALELRQKKERAKQSSSNN